MIIWYPYGSYMVIPIWGSQDIAHIPLFTGTWDPYGAYMGVLLWTCPYGPYIPMFEGHWFLNRDWRCHLVVLHNRERIVTEQGPMMWLSAFSQSTLVPEEELKHEAMTTRSRWGGAVGDLIPQHCLRLRSWPCSAYAFEMAPRHSFANLHSGFA